MNPFRNSYIILAAGHQDRWNKTIGDSDDYPKVKQLCVVHGETLLERMKRQFGDPVCFTKHPEIEEHFIRCYEPADNLTTISTMFSTKSHWREWTIILLGDVVYGRKTVKLIKAQTESVMFYGDNAEIYAIKFHKTQRENVLQIIQSLVSHPQWTTHFGKLWNLYRHMNGIDFREHSIGPRFTHVTDCYDFDTKDEYLDYFNKIQQQ